MTPVFDVVGIVVADLDKALAFYRLLGLDIPADSGRDHVEVRLPNGLRLAWDPVETIRTFDPHWTAPAGSSRISLAFRCASPAEVDRVYAELTAAGHEGPNPPWDAFWGQRYASVRDPDGNAVDLYADLPT